ncbi:MAG: ABC transporter ATP-binding protein [Chloroflexota bacterium]|nr:ABC transporter ATP-binding protein [Chloroflexota bacterium]
MENAIHLEHLTKVYGKQRGITDVCLEVHAGEVFGYLGPNGAGKTTTIRLVLDLIRPTRGRVQLFGADVGAAGAAIRRRISYLPGELALYDHLTAREFLSYFAHLRGGIDGRVIGVLAERLSLDLSRPIRSLSKGNKQKVGIVQAFMSHPDLLILDEPTDGLDPLVQQEFLRMVREVRAEGRTVFLSSHVLAEVEHVADRVGIIREGQLVMVEAVQTLKERAVHRTEIRFAQPVNRDAFRGLTDVHDLTVDGPTLRCVVTGSMDALVKAAARFEVERITSHEPDLEAVFLAYYVEGKRDAA